MAINKENVCTFKYITLFGVQLFLYSKVLGVWEHGEIIEYGDRSGNMKYNRKIFQKRFAELKVSTDFLKGATDLGGGQHWEQRNVEQPIFRNFEI